MPFDEHKLIVCTVIENKYLKLNGHNQCFIQHYLGNLDVPMIKSYHVTHGYVRDNGYEMQMDNGMDLMGDLPIVPGQQVKLNS